MLPLILHLLLRYIGFLALILDPGFWASFSSFHEEATRKTAQRWQQLQSAVQIHYPPLSEDKPEEDYEQWVDEEIKRLQYVLRELDELEVEYEKTKEVGAAVKRIRKWVDGIWIAGALELDSKIEEVEY
jgi:DNA repair ATPase RecN